MSEYTPKTLKDFIRRCWEEGEPWYREGFAHADAWEADKKFGVENAERWMEAYDTLRKRLMQEEALVEALVTGSDGLTMEQRREWVNNVRTKYAPALAAGEDK